MAESEISKGACVYCELETTGVGMLKHLPSCSQRRERIAESEGKKGAPQKLYHLRVQDAQDKSFWLDLEMRGNAALQGLDNYLRAIWLECCGHLSQFSIGGWRGAEIPPTKRAQEIFAPGVVLTHIYDFGTSSETLIKAMAVRQGKPTTSHPIALMARNLLPETPCIKCKNKAAWLCMECLIEEDTFGALCDKHAKAHEHENYGEPVPLVNSPRVGMCGYDGPAEPPY